MKEPDTPVCTCVCTSGGGVQSKQPARKSCAGKWQGTVRSVAVFLQYRLTALHSGSLQS